LQEELEAKEELFSYIIWYYLTPKGFTNQLIGDGDIPHTNVIFPLRVQYVFSYEIERVSWLLTQFRDDIGHIM
jgi:hypothetical protein